MVRKTESQPRALRASDILKREQEASERRRLFELVSTYAATLSDDEWVVGARLFDYGHDITIWMRHKKIDYACWLNVYVKDIHEPAIESTVDDMVERLKRNYREKNETSNDADLT